MLKSGCNDFTLPLRITKVNCNFRFFRFHKIAGSFFLILYIMWWNPENKVLSYHRKLHSLLSYDVIKKQEIILWKKKKFAFVHFEIKKSLICVTVSGLDVWRTCWLMYVRAVLKQSSFRDRVKSVVFWDMTRSMSFHISVSGKWGLISFWWKYRRINA